MGCGASSSAKPLVVNPPARAETAKARLEELKKPRPGAPALSGSTSGLGQKSERNLLATSTTPAVKKYALSEDFHKPRERSVSDVFKYGPLVASHKAAIGELFQKMVKDSKDSVAKGDLRDLVAKYHGADFDEKKFFDWHDVHGRSTEHGPGGHIDLHEFGLYIAESMALIIQQMSRLAESGLTPVALK